MRLTDQWPSRAAPVNNTAANAAIANSAAITPYVHRHCRCGNLDRSRVETIRDLSRGPAQPGISTQTVLREEDSRTKRQLKYKLNVAAVAAPSHERGGFFAIFLQHSFFPRLVGGARFRVSIRTCPAQAYGERSHAGSGRCWASRSRESRMSLCFIHLCETQATSLSSLMSDWRVFKSGGGQGGKHVAWWGNF
jgi:hypothetical protein